MNTDLARLTLLDQRLDRYDERLRSMRGVFGAIFWTCPYPCWMKAPNGQGDNYWVMAAINRAYEKAFSVSADTYVGQPDTAVWGPEIAAGFRLNDVAVRDGGRLVRTAEKFSLGGDMGPHLVLKWPVYESGTFQGVAGAAVGPTILGWIAKNGG
jgi:hypothetical protein